MATSHQSLGLLVVDDDDDFRESLVKLLEHERHEVVSVSDLNGARHALSTKFFDAVLVDQELCDGVGTQLLEDPTRPPSTEVVVITGHATVNDAVDALKRGAADYLTKPTDLPMLQATLSRVTRVRSLRLEVDELRDALREHGRLGPIVGRSAAMQPVFDIIQRVAPTDASVLIQGESGTGKELVAQALHQLSRRKSAALVPVNCGAIAETLIESELFGHEKGSFTGADRLHRGFFERADGGTLFLDEITEMPPQLQVKLLRVLETGHVQRIGGSTPIQTNVRVLAATNRDPEDAIKEGKLREDLYFRLAVFPITLPPLRNRAGDVELLAQHFLDDFNRGSNTEKQWKSGALANLARREWRGNVRELRNWVQRAYILADDVLDDQEPGATHEPMASAPVESNGVLTFRVGGSIAELERELIRATLEHVGGDKPAAARILGFSLKTLYNRLNVYAAAGTPS